MNVRIETVSQQLLAAVRLRIPSQEISRRFREALDQVWSFLRRRPDLHSGGHNVFIYRSDGTTDFGVQINGPFDAAGDVFCTFSPEGRVATAIHRGDYARLGETHALVRRWCAENGHQRAGTDWEIYGDWNEDPRRLETQVCCLLTEQAPTS